MNKTKVKLSSLYGHMVSGKTAFGICSRKVREIPCAKCLNFERCMREGKPVSNLGAYMAWLELKALPAIENELRPSCADGLKLEAYVPDVNESEEGAYAVVRAYDENKYRRLLFRLNLHGDEDEEALRTLVFNAYIRAKRKIKNGK